MNLLIFLFILVIAICVVIGKPIYIYIGLAAIMLLLCASMTIIFTIALFLLLFSKKRKARFTKIDLPYNSEKYKCAYYSIIEPEGNVSATDEPDDPEHLADEYPCIFPEEGVFRKKLYNPDKECTVFLVRLGRFRRVFDKYAVITTVLGSLFGIGMGGLLLALFLY
ncbi:MAG: hypothetical protein K6E85_13500 [Lachnospiraceae bacterium]|nr:hypothetical protein [Lachnospiraceae bacterium]